MMDLYVFSSDWMHTCSRLVPNRGVHTFHLKVILRKIRLRQNRTLIEALRAHVDAKKRDWDTLLAAMQLAHNSSRNHSTGAAPFEILFGATPRTALDAELERDGVEPQRQAEQQAHPRRRWLSASRRR
jgi:hypothetical protein